VTGEAVVAWTPARGKERRCRFDRTCAIGRDPGSRVLLALPGVSRQHAVLELGPAGLEVSNVSSAAPLFVTGGSRREVRPGGRASLASGDVLEIAGVALRIESVRPPTPGPRHVICAKRDCRREVPVSLADCPWCGTSTAFASTSGGGR
jgi:hypothetical protein